MRLDMAPGISLVESSAMCSSSSESSHGWLLMEIATGNSRNLGNRKSLPVFSDKYEYYDVLLLRFVGFDAVVVCSSLHCCTLRISDFTRSNDGKVTCFSYWCSLQLIARLGAWGKANSKNNNVLSSFRWSFLCVKKTSSSCFSSLFCSPLSL